MGVGGRDQQTYLPARGAADVLAFMSSHAPQACYLLSGPGADDRIEVPAEIRQILLQVLEAMRAGKAVTVAAQSQELTTQQAADLLGVSRPTVVKFVNEGKLAAETPAGVRRILRLDDVLKFRQERRREQYASLLAAEVDDYDVEDNPHKGRQHLREVRRQVGEARGCGGPHGSP